MLRENLTKLIQAAACEVNTANSPEDTDFDLVGKRIDQQFNESGKLVTYSGRVGISSSWVYRVVQHCIR